MILRWLTLSIICTICLAQEIYEEVHDGAPFGWDDVLAPDEDSDFAENIENMTQAYIKKLSASLPPINPYFGWKSALDPALENTLLSTYDESQPDASFGRLAKAASYTQIGHIETDTDVHRLNGWLRNAEKFYRGSNKEKVVEEFGQIEVTLEMHGPPHLGLMTAEEVAHVNATSGGVFGRLLFDVWRRTGSVRYFKRTERAVYLIQDGVLDCRSGAGQDEHEVNVTATKLYIKLMQLDTCFKAEKPNPELRTSAETLVTNLLLLQASGPATMESASAALDDLKQKHCGKANNTDDCVANCTQKAGQAFDTCIAACSSKTGTEKNACEDKCEEARANETEACLSGVCEDKATCKFTDEDLVKPFDPASFNSSEYDERKNKYKTCADKCQGKPEAEYWSCIGECVSLYGVPTKPTSFAELTLGHVNLTQDQIQAQCEAIIAEVTANVTEGEGGSCGQDKVCRLTAILNASVAQGKTVLDAAAVQMKLPRNPQAKKGLSGCHETTSPVPDELGEIALRLMVYVKSDGGWGEWGNWSRCSASCGDYGQRSRRRECDGPRPTGGGLDCGATAPAREAKAGAAAAAAVELGVRRVAAEDDDALAAVAEQGEECNKNVACPKIAGFWSAWALWSDCSTTCGHGGQTSRRYCDSPPPEFGGAACVVPPSESGHDVTDEYGDVSYSINEKGDERRMDCFMSVCHDTQHDHEFDRSSKARERRRKEHAYFVFCIDHMQGDFEQDLLDTCMRNVAQNETLMLGDTPPEDLDPQQLGQSNYQDDQESDVQPAETVDPEERKMKLRAMWKKYRNP